MCESCVVSVCDARWRSVSARRSEATHLSAPHGQRLHHRTTHTALLHTWSQHTVYHWIQHTRIGTPLLAAVRALQYCVRTPPSPPRRTRAAHSLTHACTAHTGQRKEEPRHLWECCTHPSITPLCAQHAALVHCVCTGTPLFRSVSRSPHRHWGAHSTRHTAYQHLNPTCACVWMYVQHLSAAVGGGNTCIDLCCVGGSLRCEWSRNFCPIL